MAYPIQYYYPVSIKHHNTYSDLIIKLVNINFMDRSAFRMQCNQCSGYSMVHVRNCNFSGRNSIYANPTVKIEYKIAKRNHTIPHKVVFKNCSFTNNDFLGMLLDISYAESTYTNVTQLMVSVSQSVFHSNKCTNVFQVNYGKYLNRCTKDDAVLISLTDVVLTSHHVFSLLHGKCISAHIEQIIISNCIAHSSILTVLSSKIIFQKNNKVTRSSAVTAITAGKIVLKETVTINFTLNNLTSVFVSNIMIETVLFEQPPKIATQTIAKCLIQYTSKQGNLDFEFQSGMSLNYSIMLYKNNITQFNDDRVTHCSWEAGYAFTTSIPLHVMKTIIHFNDNQFEKPSMLAFKRTLCVCNKKKSFCNQEELGPYFPGQLVTLTFYFKQRLQHMLFNMRNILLRPLNSDSIFVCNTSGSATHLYAKECNTAVYKISQMV